MNYLVKERCVEIRGQSSILAVVLLIGMVATISVGIFFVGAEMMTNTEYQSQQDRVEQSFVKLSQ
ncbi:hypothetical protein [Natrinema gelatinilyticum]|uniref:hypothetical protein n=1 Tax=Natrinema gelatinilyticum TaxID=2961571 RepID=UPI0020C1EBAE|nr:hypothetical protein [Natrinema gelatinilyticum]